MPSITLEQILASEEYKNKLRSARRVGIDLETLEGLEIFASEYKNLKELPACKTSTPARTGEKKSTRATKAEASSVSSDFDNPELISNISPVGPLAEGSEPSPLVNPEELLEDNPIYYRAAATLFEHLISEENKEKDSLLKDTMATAEEMNAQIQKLKAELDREKNRSAHLEREIHKHGAGPAPDVMVDLCRQLRDMNANNSRLFEKISEKSDLNQTLLQKFQHDQSRSLIKIPETFSAPTAMRSTLDFIEEYGKYVDNLTDNEERKMDGLEKFLKGDALAVYKTAKTLNRRITYTSMLTYLSAELNKLPSEEIDKWYMYREQKFGESVDTYARELKLLMARSGMTDPEKVAVFIKNLYDRGQYHHLKAQNIINFEEAIKAAKSLESSSKYTKSLIKSVNFVSYDQGQSSGNRGSSRDRSSSRDGRSSSQNRSNSKNRQDRPRSNSRNRDNNYHQVPNSMNNHSQHKCNCGCHRARSKDKKPNNSFPQYRSNSKNRSRSGDRNMGNNHQQGHYNKSKSPNRARSPTPYRNQYNTPQQNYQQQNYQQQNYQQPPPEFYDQGQHQQQNYYPGHQEN